jgi:hypothetical protein
MSLQVPMKGLDVMVYLSKGNALVSAPPLVN